MAKYLSQIERCKIEFLLTQKMSVGNIAKNLGRCPNTIRNEIRRGTVELLDSELIKYKKYCADAGQKVADYNKTAKGRPLKIGSDIEFADYVERKILKEHYSPCAVLARLPGSFRTKVCFKTIYNYIHNGIFLELNEKKIIKYRNKKRSGSLTRRLSYKNFKGKSIEERPREINLRNTFGHWEMDSVVSGKDSSGVRLLVLSERQTRSIILKKLPDGGQASVASALDRMEKSLGKKKFREVFKTITVDNGTEFSDPRLIENSVFGGKRTEVYYCHPYSSWERGTNENENRMIRRFIPKGSDIGKVSNKQLRFIQDFINDYPRKLFNWKSSRDMAGGFLAVT